MRVWGEMVNKKDVLFLVLVVPVSATVAILATLARAKFDRTLPKDWLWDRGRLAEFGIDLRGTWLHIKLNEWFYEDVPEPPRKKRSEMTAADLAHWKRYIRMARLSCFCEACIRAFLPWPLSW